MAKYNPENIKHQAWLASNVLDVLQKWGFQIDFDLTNNCWEFVCSRVDKYYPNKRIIVYTSIDKRTAGMRHRGVDRIRVIAVKDLGDKGPRFRDIAQINRVGEFKAITDRICKAIVKAQAA